MDTEILRDNLLFRGMVAEEMDKYYRQAKQIIVENRVLLDMITQELMEKKTITHRDIKAIREKIA